VILLISASSVARIIGMSYQHPAKYPILTLPFLKLKIIETDYLKP
jgi:hypothetical protein